MGHTSSQVFMRTFALNVGIFGRNLEGMEFWPSRTEPRCVFGFGHQGAELLSAKGEKIGVLAVFDVFKGY